MSNKRGRPPKVKPYVEKSRTYFFPVTNTATEDISIVPIELKEVTDIVISKDGTHRVTTKTSTYVIPVGWIAIEVEMGGK